MRMVDETHDPTLKSWVDSANGHPEFPVQNLPFCAFEAGDGAVHTGVGIGDEVLDLVSLLEAGLLAGSGEEALRAAAGPNLNSLMALGPAASTELRHALSRLLSGRESAGVRACLVSQSHVRFALPAMVRDYTDFYTSIHHATNIGRLFRPDNPLLPNYKWVPIGYHGRASSIVVSGSPIRRPVGQLKSGDEEIPVVAPCRRLDHELEIGVYVGAANDLGEAISIEEAEDHAFGLCLLNDWSARDIQAWEYQPLGPFLAKSFATTVSPWIVTMEALAPFRVAWSRSAGDPQPLSYLDSQANRDSGAVDMNLEVLIETELMRADGQLPARLSRSNFTDAYCTLAQLITHHTVNGCNLSAGDLLGSGTMSGEEPGSEGALIEMTKGGAEPVELPTGEMRSFLDDGDRIILRAGCERDGSARIGFGEASGLILPAR